MRTSSCVWAERHSTRVEIFKFHNMELSLPVDGSDSDPPVPPNRPGRGIPDEENSPFGSDAAAAKLGTFRRNFPTPDLLRAPNFAFRLPHFPYSPSNSRKYRGAGLPWESSAS